MSDTKPKKVLVLGSAALKIGEAGEFDYSGSQVIKALKEEGIRTILVNPNIATIQTSDYLADEIYFLPVTPFFVERIIAKEKPNGVMLGFGGQTALNCGLELDRNAVLDRYGVKILGTPVRAIRETEDRELFVRKLGEIGVKVPRSAAARSVKDAVRNASKLGYPIMLRAGYALGGLGSGPCLDDDEVRERATKTLAHTGQVLIEEYLTGWKEVVKLELTDLLLDDQLVPILTDEYEVQGRSQGTLRNTGVGALLGAVLDGGDGAKKGAAVGFGYSLLSRGKQIAIPAGTLIEFRLQQPLTIYSSTRG